MSVQALGWVLEESTAKGHDRLVLLAIANHADAKGYDAYPSVTQIAHEARVSRRTVFRCIEALEARGELEIERAGRGSGRRHNSYRVVMKANMRSSDTLALPNGCSSDRAMALGSDTAVSLGSDSCGTQTVLSRPKPKTLAGARAREAVTLDDARALRQMLRKDDESKPPTAWAEPYLDDKGQWWVNP